MAMMLSKPVVTPKNFLSQALLSQPATASRKIPRVAIRWGVKTKGSFLGLKLGTVPGRRMRKRMTIRLGRRIATQGIPNLSQERKSIPSFSAAMALGKVPMIVPIPPMLAE